MELTKKKLKKVERSEHFIIQTNYSQSTQLNAQKCQQHFFAMHV